MNEAVVCRDWMADNASGFWQEWVANAACFIAREETVPLAKWSRLEGIYALPLHNLLPVRMVQRAQSGQHR